MRQTHFPRSGDVIRSCGFGSGYETMAVTDANLVSVDLVCHSTVVLFMPYSSGYTGSVHGLQWDQCTFRGYFVLSDNESVLNMIFEA